MVYCPLTNSEAFKRVASATSEAHAYILWQREKGDVTDEVADAFIKQYKDPNKKVNYQLVDVNNALNKIASENTIKDLAARLSHRIGIKHVIESDVNKKYKGKLENGKAYINLAYATLDTPIHEILGHPIIRAIKDTRKGFLQEGEEITDIDTNKKYILKKITEDFDFVIEENGKDITVSPGYFSWKTNTNSVLYNNLLKELETGIGKEVLDRVKRDYNVKYQINPHSSLQENKYGFELRHYINILVNRAYTIDSIIELVKTQFPSVDGEYMYFNYPEYEPEFYGDEAPSPVTTFNEVIEALDLGKEVPYTLEEQQEEALVELLGMMTAEKLNPESDKKLITILKQLLKEIKDFIRQLITQKEIDISDLPDNLTLNDLSNILGYSNSKLILPGYKVIYTTPDNRKFNTYQEANNYIIELSKNTRDINLDNIKIEDDIPERFVVNEYYNNEIYFKEDGQWYVEISDGFYTDKEKITEEKAIKNYNRYVRSKDNLDIFILKNKDFEKSKEIIEEWKQVNNIQYNPEEIYSRGQEFISILGAYSSFDVNLMMQNLLFHIEDNEKAGGKFTISAITKPIDKKLNHLGSCKIRFKIYPKSEDILWAANIDVFSGSVWDAANNINPNKTSELLGVSYSKYPALRNIDSVQPNLANIVDNLSHSHNELGISLNFSNFEMEVDEDVPYTTKKIIENINKILQQKRLEEVNSIINKLEKEC